MVSCISEPTSRKHGIVDDRLGVDAIPGDAVVKLLLEGCATDEERDGAWPHDGVDRDDAEPDEDLVPFLYAQTKDGEAKGRLSE